MRIAISGSAKCGKDTVCEWLNNHTNLTYTGSTSWYARDEVYKQMRELGIEYENTFECYKDRARHRQIWADVIDSINEHDRTTLYRRCLKDQNILNGVRNKDEIIACKSAKLVGLVIWIDRDVPNDPTMGYGPELCDIIIQNKHDLDALYDKLRHLCTYFGIMGDQTF